MRKDVRLGMAIGGVLLLLVVVYIVVSSFSSKTSNTVASNSNPAANPSENGDQGGGIPVTDVTEGHASQPAAQPAPQPTTPTEAAGAAPSQAHPETPVAESGSQGGQQGDAGDGTHSQWMMLLDGQHDVQSALEASPAPRRSPAADPMRHALSTGGTGEDTGSSQGPVRTDGTQTYGDVLPADAIPLTGAHAARVAPATQPGARTHVVVEGDTLVKISAMEYGTSKYFALIEQANPGLNPHNLKLGTVIRIPELPARSHGSVSSAQGGDRTGEAQDASATINPATEYRVQSGDSLYRISQRLYGNAGMVQKIYDLNKAAIGPDMTRLKLNMILKLPAPPKSVQ